MARHFVDADLGPRAIVQSLEAEYRREDRFLRHLYWSFDKFKEHHDLCQNAITKRNRQPQGDVHRVYLNPEVHEGRETSEEIKNQSSPCRMKPTGTP